MKRILLVISLLVAVATVAHAAKPAKKADKSTMEQGVKERIESRDFTIRVRQALPMSGRAIMLTSLYSLKIKGDSVYSYLPYFGRAYSIPYGGGEGLIFENVLTDYQAKPGKRGKMEISFDVRTREDSFRYRVEVYTNGSSYISVTSNNRQEIGFRGEMLLSEQE